VQPDGKASKTKSLFRMEVGVSIRINARPERIWALLTNAREFPSWNSTVKSIDGTIAPGETIKLKITAVPERIFKLKVTSFEPNALMVWQDGAAPIFSGIRRYTLTPKGSGTTDFTMTETFAGLIMPMIARSLPDFRPSFEQYAADLKAAAERNP
jgi:hypothetical protein